MENTMTQKSESDLPKIGYLYHYPKLGHPTDIFRLDIFISSIPTEQHFDVLRVHLFLKTQKGKIERLSITHPWTYEKAARVCAGVVIMEDRKGKKEEAFTFGGQLIIDVKESQTVCVLVSSAPILEISGATPMHSLFIDEVEILLAEHRAAFENDHEYENRLCSADPLALYLACLKELIQKFEQFSHKGEEQLQFLIFLHSQEHRLDAAGLLRDPVVTLGEIFKN
jgi:hypothetical protein